MDPELERMIRDAYAAFAKGDTERLRHFFHEDAVYVNPPYAMESGTRVGRAAIVDMWETILSVFEYQSVEVEEVAEGRDGILVVVRYRGRGAASGAPVEVPMKHVLEIRDGLVTRLAWFGTRDEAAGAAGL